VEDDQEWRIPLSMLRSGVLFILRIIGIISHSAPPRHALISEGLQ